MDDFAKRCQDVADQLRAIALDNADASASAADVLKLAVIRDNMSGVHASVRARVLASACAANSCIRVVSNRHLSEMIPDEDLSPSPLPIAATPSPPVKKSYAPTTLAVAPEVWNAMSGFYSEPIGDIDDPPCNYPWRNPGDTFRLPLVEETPRRV